MTPCENSSNNRSVVDYCADGRRQVAGIDSDVIAYVLRVLEERHEDVHAALTRINM